MAGRTVLIVYAHQSPASFNAALRDVAVSELSQRGFTVLVSDLYAMKFNASATRDDITGELKNSALFQYGDETMHAWLEGRLSDDITAEQQKVQQAELIIFQFPLYWFSVPAIMKGWMDRVLTQGFAFSLEKMYNNGVFKDKKAILSFTTGAVETMFHPDGVNGDINVTLWPLQNGTLHFCGFQVLAPQIFWSPAHCRPSDRAAMLEKWRVRLGGLLFEEPLSFAPCELFDLSFKGGFLLRPEVKEDLQVRDWGLTTGHHLGKPLPPHNQTRAAGCIQEDLETRVAGEVQGDQETRAAGRVQVQEATEAAGWVQVQEEAQAAGPDHRAGSNPPPPAGGAGPSV